MHGDSQNKPKMQGRTADGITLPEGWSEHRSPSRGVFYAHEPTGVTQWEIPRGPPTKQQAGEARDAKYGQKLSQLHPGAKVRFIGLRFAPQLNGKTAVCDRWDHASGMVRVRLLSGELKAVKPENLMVIQASAQRLQPQKLLPGAGAKTEHAADRLWASPGFALAVVTSGVVALWAFRYKLHEADTRAREALSQVDAGTVVAASAARLGDSGVAEVAQPQFAADPAAAMVLQPLPPGWREATDPTSGRSYYWKDNSPALTTTWERPVALVTSGSPSTSAAVSAQAHGSGIGVAAAGMPQPAQVAIPLPVGWREAVDPSTSQLYYWKEGDSAATTTWVRPVA